MDPLTAFSVAGTVIQFVDFGTQLLSGANEFYKAPSGALAANVQLELVTSDLYSVLSRLGNFSNASTKETPLPDEERELEINLTRICDEAAAIAKNLMDHLERLKVDDSAKGHRRVWASLSKAVESAWTRKERDEMKSKLRELREALDSRVWFALRTNFDLFAIQVSEQFDRLDRQTQTIISALAEDRKITHAALEQTSALALVMSRLQPNSTEERHKSRSKIANVGQEEIIAKIEVLDVSYDEESRSRKLVGDKILESLRFESMSTRYEEVADAHHDTFNWIFNEPTEQQLPWTNFLDWLRHGVGPYWVKGKAGSGKSTLMKSIYEDPRLRYNLQTWASGRQLHIASFFFWNSGTKDQKSQQGLIRALLFQVLNQEPDLIPIVLPLQWSRTYSRIASPKAGLIDEPWGLRSLKDAFNLLVKQEILPFKLCMIIDGLDEFDGDHEGMSELFKKVTSQDIKVCVSSRPWIVFEECFQHCPSLRLQDLTKDDIKQYVEDRLANSTLFRRLSARAPISTASFVEEIVEKADGVFLWVILVVKSLLDGMRNRDAVEDLQKRLRRLPKELEPLYKHLLQQIEPEYLEWASKAFQIFRASQEYHMNEQLWKGQSIEEPPSLSILGLYLSLEEDLDIETVSTWTPEVITQKCEDAIVHLTVRCVGLLEVIQVMRLGSPSPDNKVQYLHRTAHDFLKTPAIWDEILSRSSVTKFNPDISLFTSYVLQLKINFLQPNDSWTWLKHPRTWVWTVAHHAMIHAYCAENQPLKAPVKLLDGLDNAMASCAKSTLNLRPSLSHWASTWTGIRQLAPATCFLQAAVMYGLVTYIERRTVLDPKLLSSSPMPLLHYSISRNWEQRSCPPPQPAIVQMLLEAGEDPNLLYDKKSPWQQALFYARGQQVRGDDWSEQLQVLQILTLMLKAGADARIYIQVDGGLYTVHKILHDAKRDHAHILLCSEDIPAEIVNLSKAIEQAVRDNCTAPAVEEAVQDNSPPHQVTRYPGDLKKSKRKKLRSWIKRLGS